MKNNKKNTPCSIFSPKIHCFNKIADLMNFEAASLRARHREILHSMTPSTIKNQLKLTFFTLAKF